MPSASMSTIRTCGSNPPLRPSAYFRVPALTIPCRAPTDPRLPIPRGLPSSLPSTLRRSLPLSSMTNRGRRSRNSGSMYLSHRSSGSRMWPSASTTLYARVIGNPSEGDRNSHILPQPRYPAHGSERAHVTRIASVKPHPISVPLNDPVWTAHEELKSSSVIVVEVRTDDGLIGYGQIHGSPMKAICAWVERFGEIVRGMDALAHVAVWDRLFSLTCPRPGGIAGADGLPPPLPRGERPQIMAAIGGIDIALWDIKGKHAGLPVWRLLGGEKRPIPTYATGGYYRPGAPDTVYAEELAGFVKAGYRAVKLKTGAGSPADEAKRARMVREPIGKNISWLPDMTAPCAVAGCIECARRVEPLDIYWLEEPLHWYLQPADFVRLAAATSIPLAHGERELTRFTVRDFIATGAIRYVQFDSTRAAGFTEGLRVAALAEQHAVMIAPHTAPELPAHLVAALPRCGFGVESHGDAARNPLSHHLLVGGPETRDSLVHLNDKPGFGVEIDWDYAKRYAA